MFNKTAFAHAIAAVTGLVYIVFYIIAAILPVWFKFLFNAQFLGADIASLIPAGFSLNDFIATWVAVVITAWIVGYVWAWLYNWFRK